MSLLILLDLFKKTFQIVGFSPHPQFLSDHLAQNAHSEGEDYRIGGRKSTLRLAVNSQQSLILPSPSTDEETKAQMADGTLERSHKYLVMKL